MNQQTLNAYLNLIQGLLSCPKGEEWILLRQNEKLVNPELVSIIEQVANHLATEGQIKEAKYLHNWAGKLHHILTENIPTPPPNQDKTNAYLELIQTLLDSPPSSHDKILTQHQELIGPELVKVIQQIASQLTTEGDVNTAKFLTDLATNLNRTWIQKHEFEPILKKEIIDDPWFDSEPTPTSSSSNDEIPTSQTEEEKPVAQEQSSTSKSAVTSEVENQEHPPELSQQLTAIAHALMKLEASLASRVQPVNPLWYMEVLEKAETGKWILTTDEVEHLIGVKPQCHHDEDSYHRGSWLFTKAGKVGAQTGWLVHRHHLQD